MITETDAACPWTGEGLRLGGTSSPFPPSARALPLRASPAGRCRRRSASADPAGRSPTQNRCAVENRGAVLNSWPISVGRFHLVPRANRAGSLTEAARFGKPPPQKVRSFGPKPYLLVRPSGVIPDLVLAPANGSTPRTGAELLADHTDLAAPVAVAPRARTRVRPVALARRDEQRQRPTVGGGWQRRSTADGRTSSESGASHAQGF